MSESKKADASRRNFLKLAGTAAPAAFAAVATSGTEAEAAASDQGSESGLRDTAHTRAYFDSARF
ncbi:MULTISPECIES: twin-arginine translocation signal domain-containing protein [unclassified Roseivivax]|uniref:twin-arginine translocation signal domain-containing protein n=1 Tax=Roseivivax sp. GX 12232 TaxID=2900547 RepID=UPI001E63E349|nr:twin-arginine translocation signal domain-containing protein [Roseivivax sp. GX 12232]MCE0505331.1 twin-arginine translocation signal domain-containing protein [Roseivivax sp. GX 12232]